MTEFLSEELPDGNQPLACGFQFEKRPDASNNQIIFATSVANVLAAVRRTGAGNAVIAAGAAFTTVAGDIADGTHLFTSETGGTGLWLLDGGAYGTGSATADAIAAATNLLIGRDTGGNYLDGTLDSLHLWMAELSPLTQDLIWRTLNEDAIDYATETRPTMTVPIWTDLTGDPLLDQYDRLRPTSGFPHRYIHVQLDSPGSSRVQVAAAVNGLVLPDAQLGGELFTYDFAELPGAPFTPPVVNDDVGWSAVADFSVEREGHYTLVVTRELGGGVILHFDVQVAP